MARIELLTVVPAKVEEVFDLSLDVGVHTASMARSGERIVGGVRAGVMGPGDTVTWAAWHFGVPWRMTSVISEFERPARFVDEQVRGPFARWRHEHHFDSDAETGGTVMRDVIEVEAPFGMLGRLVMRAGLERYLRRLIAQRNEFVAGREF